MRKGIVVNIKAADRRRLAAIVANRNSPQKQVWRARIVLLTADGWGTAEIMRQTGKSKSVVWRWQERFMQAGVDGLCWRGSYGSRWWPMQDGYRQCRSRPACRQRRRPAKGGTRAQVFSNTEKLARHGEAQLEATRIADRDAQDALTNTVPTTIAGCAALLRYAHEFYELEGCDPETWDIYRIVKNVAGALERLA
jgi:hypothetical protein